MSAPAGARPRNRQRLLQENVAAESGGASIRRGAGPEHMGDRRAQDQRMGHDHDALLRAALRLQPVLDPPQRRRMRFAAMGAASGSDSQSCSASGASAASRLPAQVP